MTAREADRSGLTVENGRLQSFCQTVVRVFDCLVKLSELVSVVRIVLQTLQDVFDPLKSAVEIIVTLIAETGSVSGRLSPQQLLVPNFAVLGELRDLSVDVVHRGAKLLNPIMEVGKLRLGCRIIRSWSLWGRLIIAGSRLHRLLLLLLLPP